MIQLFFDTTVWFDYCWMKHSRKKSGGKNFIPINKINSRKAKIVLSDPLIYEVSSLFKERFLIKDAMDQGISAFEVRRIKREITLKNSDRKKVDDILIQIVYSLSVVKNQWLVEWLDQDLLDRVFRITSTHDIEFIDCLHIMAAIIAGCEVLVTKDEPLVNGFKRASRRYRSLRQLKVMMPEKFMNDYSQKIFKK